MAVGDSLEHDIKGANGVDMASCILTGGIHACEFPPDAAPAEQQALLATLSRQQEAMPDWVVPRLAW